jgi:hypothetical protein
MENKDLDWVEKINPIIYFENLVFKAHPNPLMAKKGGIQAKGHFPINGKWYSIVGGAPGLYGDGFNTFEIGFKTDDGNIDVLGWVTKEGVEEWLIEMQSK